VVGFGLSLTFVPTPAALGKISLPPAAIAGRSIVAGVRAARQHPSNLVRPGSAVDFQLHLETETVEHCYPSKACCAAPGDSIRQVLRSLREARTGSAMVCDGDRLVGIFTERDALRLLSEGSDLDRPVSTVMVANPVTLSMNDTVGHAIALMSAGGFRRLPIIDKDGKVLGILKVSGILHYLVEHFPKVVYTLPPEPHHKPATREGA
jgi:predicted transcriptional regulator